MKNLNCNFCFEVRCAKEFAAYVNCCTFSNLTGGIMAVQIMDEEIYVYGCNLNCVMMNDVLYIDGEPAIDFDKSEILIKYVFDA